MATQPDLRKEPVDRTPPTGRLTVTCRHLWLDSNDETHAAVDRGIGRLAI